jgi:hypothetical protein
MVHPAESRKAAVAWLSQRKTNGAIDRSRRAVI